MTPLEKALLSHLTRMSNLDMCHSGMVALHELGFDDPIGGMAGGDAAALGNVVKRELMANGRIKSHWMATARILITRSQVADAGTLALVLCRIATTAWFVKWCADNG